VHLTRFSVVHTANEHEGTIIHCFVGREMVLAYVAREVLVDYFNWPKPSRDEVQPTLMECHLVVDRNLAAFARIIQEKYRQREYCKLHKLDSSEELIEITLEDIQRSGANLSDTVINIARAFRRRD
jgi:hypothetical protein